MPRIMRFIESTFSSAEAEIITGISAIRQRDLRRHGYLSGALGRKRKRYTIKELAQLAITGQLKELGLKPGASMSLSPGNTKSNISATAIVTVLIKDDPTAVDATSRLNRKGPLRLMRNQRFPKFLVIFRTNYRSPPNCRLADDLQHVFDGSTPGAIVVDLKAIARQIIDRSGKPMLRLTATEKRREQGGA